MTDLKFTSSLSMEEIEKNFKDVDFFSGIMDGLEEALAYTKGKAAAETNVREIHSALKMTQRAFAEVLGVSRRTVEAWESGKSTPAPAAKKLLFLIQEDHTLIQKLSV